MEVKRISAQQTMAIRHAVLWPSKSVEFCHVAEDEFGHHYGCFDEGQLIAVASLFFDQGEVRLRKFAVLTDYQGQGVGSKMLDTMLSDAAALGTPLLWCDARESALAIYAKFGLTKQGERFYKGEIPYFKMAVQLGS